MSNFDRREFMSRTARGGLAAAVATLTHADSSAAGGRDEETEYRFCVFTESFQDWPIPKVCRRLREIGADGLDLTLRPGGHIEPADARAKLPAAARAASDVGMEISMLTTGIVDADQTAQAILSTAGELGIRRAKLGYYRYTGFGNLREQIDGVQRRLEGIARLAQRYNVLPCVHIHSGQTIPGNGPAAYLLLKDFSPEEVGAYVDPMHMTLEGGLDGWRQGLDLLAPWIALSSMKNCKWIETNRDADGQQRWEPRKCPLADGIAPIPEFLATLDQVGYRDLFTMHSEYKDGNTWRRLSTEECLEQTKLDLDYVKSLVHA